MDKISYQMIEYFVWKYVRGKGLSVCDIGSYDMNGTCKPLFADHNYIGLDIMEGPNVDVVSDELYHYPFEGNTFDIVVSASTAEHVKDIFSWIREVERILKTGGLFCMVVPMYFRRHKDDWRTPPENRAHKNLLDCWRIYPDGMKYMMTEVAHMEIKRIKVSENYLYGMAIARKL